MAELKNKAGPDLASDLIMATTHVLFYYNAR